MGIILPDGLGATVGGLLFAIASGCTMRNTILTDANLRGARMSWTILHGANLTKANLYRANLCWSNLSEAILIEAVLIDANLNQANLREAKLSKAIMPSGSQHQ
ncbi:MAG: pentapeptide repeat-containing protein [Moorea sp. SIO3E2]|nr:pentapeptide repeat-containing protein [Moorena sp. SIO3E2]